VWWLYACLFFYFATLDSNAFVVEGEEDFEVFGGDQGQVAAQGKPSFDLMPLSYLQFCTITLFDSCIIFELILFVHLL
jgi:hypothetical protein